MITASEARQKSLNKNKQEKKYQEILETIEKFIKRKCNVGDLSLKISNNEIDKNVCDRCRKALLEYGYYCEYAERDYDFMFHIRWET